MSKFSYENQQSNTYLVYKVGEEDVLDEMSLKMITSNKIAGLVTAVYTQKDVEKTLMYNVSAKVTVKKMFSKTVSKKRLFKVLFGIANALSSAEDYMLDSDGVILDTNLIYVAVSGYETELIYLPVKNHNLPKRDLREFLKMIIGNAQFDFSENCDYVKVLLNFLKQDAEVTPESLKSVLNQLANGKQVDFGEDIDMGEAEEDDAFMFGNAADVPQTPFAQLAQVPPMGVNQQMPQMQMPQMPQEQKQMKKAAKPPKKKKAAKEQPVSPIPSAIPGAGGMEIPSAPPQMESFNGADGVSGQGEKDISIFYLLQHYNKENLAIYKEQKAQKKLQKAQDAALPKAEKKPKKKKKEKELQELEPLGFSMPGQEAGGFDMPGQMAQDFPMAGQMPQDFPAQGQGMQDFSLSGVGLSVPGQELSEPPKPKKGKSFLSKSAPAPKSEPVAPMGYAGAELDIPLEKSMDFGGTMYLPDDAYEATAYMDENEKEAEPVKHPIMIRKKDSERIEIDKPMFKMGRDRTVDDYVIPDNKYISRSHAMVLERDGRYFILDNKSKNHVSVNGERIEMDQEVELHDGDIFALGSEEFEFLLQ